MKRSAFNIIELIFVIIILGILSSVVIVKMGAMTEHSKEAQLKSFTGTLNRSVGPAVWFDSIQNNLLGSVVSYDADISRYTQIIPGNTSAPLLSNCNSDGSGIFISYTFSKEYQIHCMDGNTTTSPMFRLYNLTDTMYLE